MSLAFRKFKKSTSRIFSALIVITVIALMFLYSSWVLTQINHTIAFYYVYNGDISYKHGKFQDAVNNYNYALQLYPGHVKANYNLGNIYSAYEDYQSAVICYDKALSFDPNYISARINLGIVLSQKLNDADGIDIDRAIQEFILATRSKPLVLRIPFIYDNYNEIKKSKAIAYYNLGYAYKSKSLLYESDSMARRDYLKKAAQSYKSSLDIIPSSYDAQYNYALVLQLLGDASDSMREYCKSINLEPLSYEAHYNLAMLLKQRRLFKESINELEKAGIILDSNGESYKTRYIYQVLNDVTQKDIALNGIEKNKTDEELDESPARTSTYVYISGKIVANEKLDKEILVNMKTCQACKLINQDDDE